MKKIFISFSEKDRTKVSILEDRLKRSNYLKYVIVADKYYSSILISEKISDALESCHYFLPIITENSINTQWVNQEIGYAKCLKEKLSIFPIVQADVINQLNGFIHKEMSSFFSFKKFDNNPKKEKESFKTCVNKLVHFLELQNGKGNTLSGIFKGLWRNDYIFNDVCDVDIFDIDGETWNDNGKPLFRLTDIEIDDTGTEVVFTKEDITNEERKIRNILKVISSAKLTGKESNGARVIYRQFSTPPLNAFYKTQVNKIVLPKNRRIEIEICYENGSPEKRTGFIIGQIDVYIQKEKTSVVYYKHVDLVKYESFQKTGNTILISLIPSYLITGFVDAE